MSHRTIVRALALAAALAVPSASSPAGGSVLHVPAQYPTIGAALDAVQSGDTVLVADGVYSGPGNSNLGFGASNILVRSENGPANCIIDGLGIAKAFHFGASGYPGVVEGFTIRNCSGDTGGAVEWHHASHVVFRRCVFLDNQASFMGGAILVWHGASVELIECVFLRNRAPYGGAVAITQSLGAEIVGCTFVENHATIDGGALLSRDVAIWSSIFARNTASGAGGAIKMVYGMPTIRCSTLAYNTAATFGGGIASSGASIVEVSDSIVWGNAAPNGPEIALLTDSTGTTLALGYCDLRGGPAAIHTDPGSTLVVGSGNIALDPLFLDVSADDYHIAPNSPARDAGDPAPMPFPSKLDIDLEPRFFPPRLDMGADEVLELATRP